MNELEFLLGQLEPPAARRRPKRRSKPRVNITDCDSPGQIGSLIDEIMGFWEQGARQLTLDFGEINEMPPNSALRLYDLLQQRPPGTTIITMAHSPIIGPGVLPWLAIPDRQYVRRYIRPTGWLFLRRPNPEGQRRRRPFWLDEEDSWRQTEADSPPNFMEMDYVTVLRLISQYLPVKALVGKVLTPALLDEFDLLDPELMKGSRPKGTSGRVSPKAEQNGSPRAKDEDRSAPSDDGPLEKRIWFIELNSKGRFTLRGGFARSQMEKEPELRGTDIGLNFATKEQLLGHLNAIEFCLEGDKVVVDGDRIVMG